MLNFDEWKSLGRRWSGEWIIHHDDGDDQEDDENNDDGEGIR